MAAGGYAGPVHLHVSAASMATQVANQGWPERRVPPCIWAKLYQTLPAMMPKQLMDCRLANLPGAFCTGDCKAPDLQGPSRQHALVQGYFCPYTRVRFGQASDKRASPDQGVRHVGPARLPCWNRACGWCWAAGIRIGEANNPGPTSAFDGPEADIWEDSAPITG